MRSFHEKFVLFVFLTITSVIMMNSCTVTKRVHRKGFHVEWRKSNKTQDQNQKQDKLVEKKKIMLEDSQEMSKTNAHSTEERVEKEIFQAEKEQVAATSSSSMAERKKIKSPERIKAEEIAARLKLNLGSGTNQSTGADTAGTAILVIGIILLFIALGILVYLRLETEKNGNDLGGCLESFFLIIIYGLLVIGLGLTGIIMIIIGAIVLSSGRPIRKDEKLQGNDDAPKVEKTDSQ